MSQELHGINPHTILVKNARKFSLCGAVGGGGLTKCCSYVRKEHIGLFKSVHIIRKLEKNILNRIYVDNPSMYKFQELMNKSNKRDAFRLMIYWYIKIVIKDYDSTM